MAKDNRTLIRVVGALQETIPGIGFTTRGEPFEVPDKETYDLLVVQTGRFQKVNMPEKKAKKNATPDTEA